MCLLHADLDPSHEVVVATELRARGLDVCASHEVSPEMREYERTVTTVVNAALRPVCRPYLRDLADVADQTVVMTSAGGLLDVEQGAELPATLLLSGPAAGARAAAEVARACGHPDALSFDMGGTSTDVCLILDGTPAVTAEHTVAGFPVRLPSVDIHTIGAGGGSIARIDEGGALVVGPASAGADPGPAAYGLGGLAPTVTDANVVLGRIPADSRFGTGDADTVRTLDLEAARTALASAGVDADGVVAVVNAGMEQALRQVSVVRGVDPAALALVAFGGAGPLHACALAEAMGMTTVIVPAAAGVLSAVGLLIAPRHRELARSWRDGAVLDGLDDALASLATAARAGPGRRTVHGRHRGRLPLRRAEPRPAGVDGRRVRRRPRASQRLPPRRPGRGHDAARDRRGAGAVRARRGAGRLGGPVAGAGRRSRGRGPGGLHDLGPGRLDRSGGPARVAGAHS